MTIFSLGAGLTWTFGRAVGNTRQGWVLWVASAIIFLVSLFGTSHELPENLRRWPTVVQPWAEWSVHGRLSPQQVAGTLGALLCPGTEVADVQLLTSPTQAHNRGHARARFEVRQPCQGRRPLAQRPHVADRLLP